MIGTTFILSGCGFDIYQSPKYGELAVDAWFSDKYLGDTRKTIEIYDKNGNSVVREIVSSDIKGDSADKKGFSHYMQKEIYEQPAAISNTIEGRITSESFVPKVFGHNAEELLSKINHVQIVACGTSYHAGLIARYWLEELTLLYSYQVVQLPSIFQICLGLTQK